MLISLRPAPQFLAGDFLWSPLTPLTHLNIKQVELTILPLLAHPLTWVLFVGGGVALWIALSDFWRGEAV